MTDGDAHIAPVKESRHDVLDVHIRRRFRLKTDRQKSVRGVLRKRRRSSDANEENSGRRENGINCCCERLSPDSRA